MRRKQHKAMKIVMFLMLAVLTLYLNQLIVPHFIAIGIIQIKGLLAIIINSFFIIAIFASMFAILKRHREFYDMMPFFFFISALNSLINIGASIIYKDDTMQFIGSLYKNPEFIHAFIFSQVLIVSFSFLTFLFLKRNRTKLRRKI